MTTKTSSHFYAATITYRYYIGEEIRESDEVITRANRERLEEIVKDILSQDDDLVDVVKAVIHDRTYTKEEAKQLRLIGSLI